MSDANPPGTERVEVRVILTVGDQAVLSTPWHTSQEPLWMPAETIARDAGLPANELPGRRFTAAGGPDGLTDFQLVDDPRL